MKVMELISIAQTSTASQGQSIVAMLAQGARIAPFSFASDLPAVMDQGQVGEDLQEEGRPP